MNRLHDLLGPRVEGEAYLTTEEAARYVGRPSRASFIAWARARCRGLPLRRPPGGRVFVVRKADLDAALGARENATEVRATAPVAGAVQSGSLPTRRRRRWGGATSFNAVDLMLMQRGLQRLRDATPAPATPLKGTEPPDNGPASAVVTGADIVRKRGLPGLQRAIAQGKHLRADLDDEPPHAWRAWSARYVPRRRSWRMGDRFRLNVPEAGFVFEITAMTPEEVRFSAWRGAEQYDDDRCLSRVRFLADVRRRRIVRLDNNDACPH